MYLYIFLGLVITLFAIFGLINKERLVDKIIFIQIAFGGLIILLSSISMILQKEFVETFIYVLVSIFSLISLFGVSLLFYFIKNGKNLFNTSLEITED